MLTTEYDRLNRIASHDYAHRAPNHPLVSSSSNTHRAYEYNKQNELIKVHDAIRGTQHYTYDKEGRLTGHFSDRNGLIKRMVVMSRLLRLKTEKQSTFIKIISMVRPQS